MKNVPDDTARPAGLRRLAKRLGFFCALAVMLTLATLAIPVTVVSSEHLHGVRFGYPFAFVEQDLRRYSPPDHLFPIKFRLDSPWGSATRLHPLPFLLSVVVVLLPLVVLTKAFGIYRAGWVTQSRLRSLGLRRRDR